MKSVEIQGIAEAGSDEKSEPQRIKIQLLSREKEISTIRVDNITVTQKRDNRKERQEEALLRQRLAALLEVEEERLEVWILG